MSQTILSQSTNKPESSIPAIKLDDLIDFIRNGTRGLDEYDDDQLRLWLVDALNQKLCFWVLGSELLESNVVRFGLTSLVFGYQTKPDTAHCMCFIGRTVDLPFILQMLTTLRPDIKTIAAWRRHRKNVNISVARLVKKFPFPERI